MNELPKKIPLKYLRGISQAYDSLPKDLSVKERKNFVTSIASIVSSIIQDLRVVNPPSKPRR